MINKPQAPKINRQLIRQRQLRKIFEGMTGSKHFNAGVIFVLVFVLLLLNWFPDAVSDLLFVDEKRSPIYKLGACVVILSGFWFFLRTKLNEKFNFKIFSKPPKPTRFLLVFLSRPNFEIDLLSELIQSKKLTRDFFDVSFNNWKMALLAIQHHSTVQGGNPAALEKVYVVTSSGSEGTHQHFLLFQNFVHHFYPNLKVEELSPNGVDFENIEAVYQLLDTQLFAPHEKRGDYSVRDLTVDITGGSKTNSIAAAMVTFAVAGRTFQYVSTNDYEVLVYDIEPAEQSEE